MIMMRKESEVKVRKKILVWMMALVMTASLIPQFAMEASAAATVAETGDISYSSLSEALDAAEDGDKVTLTSAGDEWESVRFTKPGCTVMVDLSDNTFNGKINVTSGELIIYNGAVNNSSAVGGDSQNAVSDTGMGTVSAPKGSEVTDGDLMVYPNGYKITVNAGAGGTLTYKYDMNGDGNISSSEYETAESGIYKALTRHTFVATPDDQEKMQANVDGGTAVVSVDKATGTATAAYTNLNNNRTLDVEFGAKYFETSMEKNAPYGGTVKAYSEDENGNTVTTSIASGKTSATAETAYGGSQTIEVSPSDGYRLLSIEVDGKTIEVPEDEQYNTYTFDDWTVVKENHEIKVNFEKTSLFIMIDAGHYAYANKGAISGYWESKTMWTLHNYLVDELEEYPGIITGKTRTTQSKDLALESRGKKSAGYDLFISMHSNSGGSSAKYALAIVTSTKGTYRESKPIGTELAKTIRDTMNTGSYQVWTKKQSNGTEWYGVLRGAASVGTPGIILEHSFHSNTTMCRWLMKDSNLKKMAEAEAETIADFYGLEKDGTVATPKKVTGVDAVPNGPVSAIVKWDKSDSATGYRIYRSTSKTGSYTKVGTVSGKSNTSFTDTGLETGKYYYYKVSAVRSYTSGGKTKTVEGVKSSQDVVKPRPKKPTIVLSAGNTTMTVSWSAVDGADGYEIYMSRSKNGTYSKVTDENIEFGPYIATGLKSNTTYYFKARAYTYVDGKKVYSNYSSVASKKTSK